MRMRDLYPGGGVAKVKNIMSKQCFTCMVCGMSHSKANKAKQCCKKQKNSYNKNQAEFQSEYNRVSGNIKGA